MSNLKGLLVLGFKGTGNTPILLSSHFDSSFQYEQTQEWVNLSKVVGSKQKTRQKMTFNTQNNYQKCFMWTTADNLCGVAITDPRYNQDSGEELVSRLISDFRDYFQSISQQYKSATQDQHQTMRYENIYEIFNWGQNPNEVYKLQSFEQDLNEIKNVQLTALESVLNRGSNINTLMEKTKDLEVQGGYIYVKSRDAKNAAIDDNEKCCGCLPQKPSLIALSYAYVISLVLLIIFDLFYLKTSTFLAIWCLLFRIPLCFSIPLFLKFRADEYRFDPDLDDSERDKKVFKLKLGGGITVFCMFLSLMLSMLYFVWATAAGAGYIYLFFFRYKEGADDDDGFQRQQDSQKINDKFNQAKTKAGEKMMPSMMSNL